jgi:hypothetical protein
MKSILIILSAFVSILGLTSCHDTGPEMMNTIDVLKDNVDWPGTVRVYYAHNSGDSLLNIGANVHTNTGNLDEDLYFFKVPPRVGVYPVFPYSLLDGPIRVSSIIFEIQDGDILYGSFNIDTTKSSFLSIESFDTTTRQIVISFESFYFTPATNFTPAREVAFTEGQIKAVVEE